MPQHELGSYYRPIPSVGTDITWSNRPLLCRLGVHQPSRLTPESPGYTMHHCLRCPYYWWEPNKK